MNINVSKCKKTMTMVSLVCMGLSVLMLISAIFGVKIFEGVLSNILLTLVIIAVSSFFCINSLSIYAKNRVMSIISLSFLLLDSICGIALFWLGGIVPSIVIQCVAVLSITTVFFVICVSNSVNFGEKYKKLQSVTYSLIIILDIALALIIFGVKLFDIEGVVEAFATICLIVFAFLCTLKILSKKVSTTEPTINNVVLTKAEYDELLNKIEKLEQENKQLKAIKNEK